MCLAIGRKTLKHRITIVTEAYFQPHQLTIGKPQGCYGTAYIRKLYRTRKQSQRNSIEKGKKVEAVTLSDIHGLNVLLYSTSFQGPLRGERLLLSSISCAKHGCTMRLKLQTATYISPLGRDPRQLIEGNSIIRLNRYIHYQYRWLTL